MKASKYLSTVDPSASIKTGLTKSQRQSYLIREIGRGKRVLDLGCLDGAFSSDIASQNNEVYAVELNEKAARIARKRGIHVKVFDLNEGIPFQDGYFDLVFAGAVLEQIYDTKFLLEECNRVLKPRGSLLLTTPNLNSAVNRFNVLRGRYPENLGAYPEDHFGANIRLMNIGKIRELCKTSGFSIAGIRGVNARRSKSKFGFLLSGLLQMFPSFTDFLVVKARKQS